MSVVVEQPAIDVSEAAAKKVRELIAEEADASLKLRVYITGGGCSGFQYGFGFESQVNDDDLSVAAHGITVLVDPVSLQYLDGAAIDYSEGLTGAQFTVKNPNASTTCGCGSSFSV
jgi:iron-sulfur cluster insertion protein